MKPELIDWVPVTVTVRPADDAPGRLWCWAIVETRGGAVVEDSWQSAWEAYASPEEARAAGLRRLTEHARARRAATAVRRRTSGSSSEIAARG